MSHGLSPEFVDVAADVVRRRTGLVFPETRRQTLVDGLGRAMHRAALSDPNLFLSHLSVDSALLEDLAGEITVGETYFFREPEQLGMIRKLVLPDLLSHAGERPLRLWSAGCATGEEPYSLAILMHQMGLAQRARILATDISRAALGKARRGRYTRWSLRGVPADVVETYFRPTGNEFELAGAVRDAVEFRYLNLAEDGYPSLPTAVWGMDLILCRNVLIYFDAPTIERVALRLVDSLGDHGWLLLGASDPLIAESARCEVVLTEPGLAFRRRGREAGAAAGAAVPRSAATVEPVPPADEPRAPPQERAAPPPDDAAEATRRYVARDYGGAAELAKEALRGAAGDPALWVVLVRSLANRGHLAEAGRACAAALEGHGTAAELVYLHAVLLSEAKRHAEAAAAARRALYLDRGLVVAHLALGGALARLGDRDGAGRAFRNAERLLTAMPPTAMVPASDGETTGRLAEMARVQLQLLGEAAA